MSFSGLNLTDLTQGEETALRAYKTAQETSAKSHCFDMNSELRAGLRVDEMTPALASTVRALDSVFNRCPKSSSPLTVFSGTGSRAFLPILDIGFRFRSRVLVDVEGRRVRKSVV